MKKHFLLLAWLVLAAGRLPAQTNEAADPYAGETAAQRDARMAWWREARFGLFIHWGVYAVPAGAYNGKPIGGIGEWIMRNGRIPVAEYKAFAQQFNPVKYDPEAWVRLAKRAGMRYIVITAKHHDGFALYDSAATDWDVAGATPHRKDLLQPLVEAASREGLKIGFYYSQAQDWVHPGGAKSGFQDGEGWDDAQKGSFDEYLQRIAVPQVKEILSAYPIDVLWWDTPHLMNKERAEQLLPLLRLRPGLIHNNRLGGGYAGDTETPEQTIPATGFPGRDWETCMTLNDTWGFKNSDQNWKSVATLIRNLVDIASKGGNYLLNVGPTAEGEIPAASVERLEAVGRWMDVNGEAIHGTTASPFLRLPWGRCTRKTQGGETTLYLHIFRWPGDGVLRVPGLKNDAREVRLLSKGEKLVLARQQKDTGLEIGLPFVNPDPICSVVAVEVAGALDVEAVSLRQGRDGKVILKAEMAELNNPSYGMQMELESKKTPGEVSISSWGDPRASVKWTFIVDKPGAFEITAEIANGADSSRFTVQVGRQAITATVGTTGDLDRFKEEKIGRITLDRPGQYELSMRPDPQGWRPIRLCEIILTPLK